MISIKKTCLHASLVALACLNFSACRSAYIQTAIINRSGTTASLIEVDYPNASFGTQQIADGAAYKYHFKVQDSGPIKITFTEGNKTYSVAGPTLSQGQQGTLAIVLEGSGKVVWTSHTSVSR